MGVAEKEAKKPFMGKNPQFELGMKVSLLVERGWEHHSFGREMMPRPQQKEGMDKKKKSLCKVRQEIYTVKLSFIWHFMFFCKKKTYVTCKFS